MRQLSPVFVMEIIFIECSNKFLVLLFDGLQIHLRPILIIVRIKIIGEKYTNIIKTFHINKQLKQFKHKFTIK